MGVKDSAVSVSLGVILFLEPGEFDGAIFVLVAGDSPDICVTFLEASSSHVNHMLGCERTVISVPPRPLSAACELGEVNILAETKRWQGIGSLTTDMGKISTEAAGLK